MNCSLPISTSEGRFVAHYSSQGLVQLDFPGDHRPAPARESNDEIPAQVRSWHDLTTTSLKTSLAGRPPKELPPLDLSAGTIFQRQVWHALLQIAAGKTRSYADIASRVGKPGAARAVGGACGANPIPVLVPCHRVLAANHRLGGFSGGLDWKRRLLALEGVELSG
jgi:O-6-methylguanine DNA methyltransferase